MANAQEVKLNVSEVLYESGQPIENIYFPQSGMSLYRDPYVGWIQYRSSHRGHGRDSQAFIQVAGHGFKIPAMSVCDEFQRQNLLRDTVLAYFQFIFVELAQCAACNRLHNLEERLARWLLMVADRMNSNEFLLTHDFIGQMLGTRRSSVTLAADTLQRAKLIRYGYGQMNITNRKGLEKVSCECYALIRDAWNTFHQATKTAN